MSKSNQVVCHIFLECALNKNLWMGVGRCWEETLEVRKRKRKEVNFHPCAWDKHGASHVTVTVELAQWSTFLWGKKKETPVSICHLMHNRDFVSYYYYFIFLHYPDPQDVTHTYIFCLLFISHSYAPVWEIQPHIITGGSEQTGEVPTGQSLLVTRGSVIIFMDAKIHTNTLERCNTLNGLLSIWKL